MKEDFVYRCEYCCHSGLETTDDVSCCNCCGEEFEDGTVVDCFSPED